MFVLEGPKSPVLALAFSPDATTLYASHYAAGGVTIFDLATRASRALKVEGERAFGEVALHPGGRWAFSHRRIAPQSVALDLTNGKVKPLDAVNPWDQLALAPDGKRLTTVCYVGDASKKTQSVYGLRGWKVTAAGPKNAWELRSPADADAWVVAFVGNDALVTEDRLPSRYSKRHGGHRPATRLSVRSAATGKVSATFDSPYEGFESRHLLAPPDGRCLVARRGLSLHVWDAEDWEKPPIVVPGKEATRAHLLRAASFHPSEPYLLLAGGGPSVTALDTKTWKPARRWNWKSGALRAVAVSPDGALAAAAGPRGAIVVWDLDL